MAWKKAGYVILRLFGQIRQDRVKTANLMILMGVLVILFSVESIWWQYRINHSVIDLVDTSSQNLSSNSNSPAASLFRPTRTPFLPPTLTPFQPQNDQEASNISGIGLISDASPSRTGLIPDRLIIPAINLEAPVVPIHYKIIEYDNQILEQWLVPNTFAVGWHDTSALLGLPGNTVLNGHHNAYGQVFKDLINLKFGDSIEVYSGDSVFKYHVVLKMLFSERNRPIEERIANARWILPSDDERLTLNTCWPPDSNTDRVVIVAYPINK